MELHRTWACACFSTLVPLSLPPDAHDDLRILEDMDYGWAMMDYETDRWRSWIRAILRTAEELRMRRERLRLRDGMREKGLRERPS